ncbi:CDP-diacylglycerol--glycerol-3-phosphate 3-phosphatidyltransferase [Alphaproteobacteria bacterium]|nr:CDP-diacylglycerol--glycerol-3-phosphate 3-phosphatidyltransferase [Alphaproteobacteria bacterium]
MIKYSNIPNLLTFSRLILIPSIIIIIYFDRPYSGWLSCLVFIAAAITDYLDGKLARKWNSTSKIGALLDPIADKMLVLSILFMLAYNNSLNNWLIFPSLIILLRELFISGLREYLSSKQIELPVSVLAKWKTSTQFIALVFLLLSNSVYISITTFIGSLFLYISAILTLITWYKYLTYSKKYF